jgi:replicative DNA helicase
MSSAAAGATPTFEFDAEFQKKIAAHVVRDEMFMRRADGLVKKEYFEDEGLQWLVDYASEHYRRFQQTPTLPIIANDLKTLIASKRMKDETLQLVKPYIAEFFNAGVDLSNRDYMVEQVAHFAKKQAMEAAIIASAEIMDQPGGGDFSKIAKLIEDARQVGSIDDGISFEFWSSAKERADVRMDSLRSGKKTGITTGYKELDDALYNGGWGRGELNVLMGPPKIGKSIGLGDFGINASLAGYNVMYLTLENSAKITGDRMDANASGELIRDLLSKAATVRGKIETTAMSAGKLFVHEFPTGTLRPMDVHRLVRKYQSQGYQIDLVVIDYADIMAPDAKTGAENTDSKEIYKGIRAIAQLENLAVLTATQTNRAGAAASMAKITDVSEDINRVRLADVFMILAATDQEKSDDQFRLFLAAMRNSESGILFVCRSDRKRMKFIKSISKETL